MREIEHEQKTSAENKAASLWATFTENERAGVRFGMFPHGPMMEAEREGYNGHQLAVALMKIESAQPRPVPQVKRGRR